MHTNAGRNDVGATLPEPVDRDLMFHINIVNLNNVMFSSPSAAALGEQYFKKSVCLLVCVWITLFCYV